MDPTLEDLIERDDPGIALLRDWAARPDATPSLMLAPDPDLARRSLLKMRVTTRSLLGAIVYETGGVSVADGLIRLWGSGSERSLLAANDAVANSAGDGILLIADDAFGGLFALNGGGFGRDGAGEVFHLPADEALWASLDVGHSDFVAWCLNGDLGLLYGPGSHAARMARCPKPSIGRVLSTYPFAWTQEGRSGSLDIREVEADEHLRLRIDLLGFAVEENPA